MRIEVTADDIECGTPEEPLSCPLARAITRATGYPTSVDGTHAFVNRGDRWALEVPLPAAAQQFVTDFDADEQVEPFAFDLPFDGSCVGDG